MIREQCRDTFERSHHGFGETVESALRSEFREHTGAGIVELLQTLDELYRRRNLAREDVDDLFLNTFATWIEVAAHVGDHGNTG